MSSIVPIIVGPTAIGKTDLALYLSGYLDAEIVSADSRQIYKKLNIGTAKPKNSELSKARHHFVNILDPEDYYSAGMYAKQARQVIADILDRNKIPIVVGGSGLYIKALVDGIFEADYRDEDTRKKLDEQASKEGLGKLYKSLSKVDPYYAKKISPNDQKRIVRALEVYQLSDRAFSSLQAESTVADFKPSFIGLNMDRQQLYSRINERVDKMIGVGLIEEVRELKATGCNFSINALNTVGYKEVFDYLENKITLQTAIDLIKQNTRRYAKRQLTWFRQDQRIRWYPLAHIDEKNSTFQQILTDLQNRL